MLAVRYGQMLAIRRVSQRIDLVEVEDTFLFDLPSGDIPNPQSAILTARDKVAAIRAEGKPPHRSLLVLSDDFGTRGRIEYYEPHFPGSFPAREFQTRSREPSVGRLRHNEHPCLVVPLLRHNERANLASAGNVPKPKGP